MVDILLMYIANYFKLNYHRLIVVIMLVVIIWLFYCRPLVVILLVTINGYSISGY